MATADQLFLLFETAPGYFLFECGDSESLGQLTGAGQEALDNGARFAQTVRLVSSALFHTQAETRENLIAIAEGRLPGQLKRFLDGALPTSGRAVTDDAGPGGWRLGLCDLTLARAIASELSVPCTTDELVFDLLRAVRLHLPRYWPDLAGRHWVKSLSAGAHLYSSARLRVRPARADSLVLHAANTVKTMSRDFNALAMSLRDCYSVHFPELSGLVKDSVAYARIALCINDRLTHTSGIPDKLEEAAGSAAAASEIMQAARTSTGNEVTPADLAQLHALATQVVSYGAALAQMRTYLSTKMKAIAPNLTFLLGVSLAAGVIQHAGTLERLAKLPASTIQVLGAETALFKALRARSHRTPKFGVLAPIEFVARARGRDKGRLARTVANKTALCARIDAFSDDLDPSAPYGRVLRAQLMQREAFQRAGTRPERTRALMARVTSGDLPDVAPAADVTKAAARKPATLPPKDQPARTPRSARRPRARTHERR